MTIDFSLDSISIFDFLKLDDYSGLYLGTAEIVVYIDFCKLDYDTSNNVLTLSFDCHNRVSFYLDDVESLCVGDDNGHFVNITYPCN